MKKILILTVILLTSVLSANAQFERGTKYAGVNLSGLGLSYSKDAKFTFGVSADAGYFIADGWMLKGNVGYNYQHKFHSVNIGAGARYYFLQNGVFLGAGLAYEHLTPNFNSLCIPVEIGYCFYVNHHLAIEPSVYYKMSLNDFADRSTVGLKIGVGYFF